MQKYNPYKYTEAFLTFFIFRVWLKIVEKWPTEICKKSVIFKWLYGFCYYVEFHYNGTLEHWGIDSKEHMV